MTWGKEFSLERDKLVSGRPKAQGPDSVCFTVGKAGGSEGW